MDIQKAQQLLKQYRDGTISDQDRAYLESWYGQLAKTAEQDPISEEDLEIHLKDVWKSLAEDKRYAKPSSFRLLAAYLSAACVLIGVIGAAYFFYVSPNDPKISDGYINDAEPGDNRAILTLQDGSQILLDKIKDESQLKLQGINIIKAEDGQLVYAPDLRLDKTGKHSEFNTVSTPRAGQFRVVLPDGTKAWLNAASSIKFPTSFQAPERLVSVTGEVYFEVAKHSIGKRRVPFKVVAGNQVVEVLGTHFNINSYQNEERIKTTLLEGSIRVSQTQDIEKGVLLRPGQQSELPILSSGTVPKSDFEVHAVDAAATVAWKDGYFRFDQVGLTELMRQLERWYDVQVVYTSPIKEYEFVGQIPRNTPLSKVLKILEMGDVHFRVEGKKIIVTD